MIEEIVLENRTRINTLTTDCIIHLHDLLSKNYHLLKKMDPVEPKGVKNMTILESAVYRQQIGSDGWYKYDTVFKNCATLMFGLIKNHPFHNGNKRVAFLATIKHLFENGYVIKPDIKHSEIYEVLLGLADRNISIFFENLNKSIFPHSKPIQKWSDEKIIDTLSIWLRRVCESKNLSRKSKIRVQYLRELLEMKGIKSEINGTFLNLYQIRDRKILGIFKSSQEIFNQRTYGMGNSMSEVGIKLLTLIRKDYNLTQKDGFDNISFYDSESFLDQEIISYKQIIYKLSQT